LLVPKNDLNRLRLLRRAMGTLSGVEQMEIIIERMAMTDNNAEFLNSIKIPESGEFAPVRKLPRAA
jgi:transcription termination factor Rho